MPAGVNPKHLRLFVVRPALHWLGLWSPAAEDLVVGTAAVETQLRALDQITSKADVTLGPAYGLFQIEPATHRDLYDNYLEYREPLRLKLRAMQADWPDEDTQLATNLPYAAAVCRLIYYRRPQPLPAHGDVRAYGAYWKAHFNTKAGKGTVAKFMAHWEGCRIADSG